MSYKSLSELKIEAEQLCPNHSFTWSDYGSYGRPKESSLGTCRYCTAIILVKEFSRDEKISGSALTQICLSVGRTVDPDGLAVTTHSICKDCGKKINPKNKNEVVKGFHTRCQNKYDGTLVLDIHDGQVHVWMQPFLPT